MDVTKLHEVLEKHAKWARGEPGGERANLSGANLSGAYLRGAYLRGADLRGADLSGASLDPAEVSRRTIVPEYGAFHLYKRIRNGVLVRLRVPAEAARLGGLTGRKCRVEWAVVDAYLDRDGREIDRPEWTASLHDPDFLYPPVGEAVRPTSWNDDARVECAPGIHGFLRLVEAAEYE
jgi:hypothetical protein